LPLLIYRLHLPGLKEVQSPFTAIPGNEDINVRCLVV
jgi:hypothetical protein